MSRSSRRIVWTLAWLIAASAGVALVLIFGKPQAPIASTQPVATIPAPANEPAPTMASEPSPPHVAMIQTYGQLLHAELPHYPDTRPWEKAVDLENAAHIVLREPVYVCSHGDLWISRKDADPLPAVLARAANETEHIVDRPIEFVLWTTDKKGASQAAAICNENGADVLISANDREPIPGNHKFHWHSAMSWDDNGVTRLIVPCDGGVSMIGVGDELAESYCSLVDSSAATRPNVPAPNIAFDNRGLLAWIGADSGYSGTARVARFVDGKWNTLDSAAWPSDVIHLVPMLDGHVLQIRKGDAAGSVQLTLVPLEAAPIDEEAVGKLVAQFDDDDPAKRNAAYERLTQYGPEVYSVLEKLSAKASLEAQGKIHELLDGQMAPNLGGRTLIENQLSVVSRLPDGGVIFYAPQGVSVPQVQGEPQIVCPDYLVIRPGRAVLEVPREIVTALETLNAKLTMFGEEYVLVSADKGPMRWLAADQFPPILRASELKYSKFSAIDGRGRWIFRQPDQPANSGPTLIIDPTVPDPTPRLAMWFISTATDVGWNRFDWPAIKMKDSKWVVGANELDPMDLASDKILDHIPPEEPTTGPTTNQSDGSMLLRDSDGNKYYGGRADLTVVSAAGARRTWTLPTECADMEGEPVHLVRDSEDRFLLFNSIGRIALLRATPDEKEPFHLDAVFTKNIPAMEGIHRAWLDPAGRIAIEYGTNLLIIFPTGQIPEQLSEQILPQDLKRSEP